MTEKVYTLLFLVKNDKTLLAIKKRGFGAGLWNGIGGKIDPHETIEQALVRECQEEIKIWGQFTFTADNAMLTQNIALVSTLPGNIPFAYKRRSYR